MVRRARRVRLARANCVSLVVHALVLALTLPWVFDRPELLLPTPEEPVRVVHVVRIDVERWEDHERLAGRAGGETASVDFEAISAVHDADLLAASDPATSVGASELDADVTAQDPDLGSSEYDPLRAEALWTEARARASREAPAGNRTVAEAMSAQQASEPGEVLLARADVAPFRGSEWVSEMRFDPSEPLVVITHVGAMSPGPDERRERTRLIVPGFDTFQADEVPVASGELVPERPAGREAYGPDTNSEGRLPVLYAYLSLVRQDMEPHWRPGELVGRMGGTPAGKRLESHIFLRLDAVGRVRSVRVERSSGSADLDRYALDSVRQSAPFVPPPRRLLDAEGLFGFSFGMRANAR